MVENDLSVAMRGMAVEEDFSVQAPGFRAPPNVPLAGAPVHQSQPPQVRGAPGQHGRAPYGNFPQPDFSGYYGTPSRVDYPYPYDGYPPTLDPSLYAGSPALSSAVAAPGVYSLNTQGLHPHAIPDLQHLGQQAGVYFDYSGSARPASQFFYPTQPLMYHGPGTSLPGGPPTGLFSDKKRDFQVFLSANHFVLDLTP